MIGFARPEHFAGRILREYSFFFLLFVWPSAKYLPGGSASGLVDFSLSSFVLFFGPSSAIGLLPLAFLLLFPSV